MLSKWDAKTMAGQIAATWIDEKILTEKIQEKWRELSSLTDEDIKQIKYELHVYAEHLRLIH